MRLKVKSHLLLRTVLSNLEALALSLFFVYATNMGSNPDHPTLFKVLVVGTSYGGVATAVNLLDLADRLTPRQASEPYTHHPDSPAVRFEITIVDERDGYCTWFVQLPSCAFRFQWLIKVDQIM
jgi:hypothetical protein